MLLQLIMLYTFNLLSGQINFDFNKDSNANDWYIVNDGVMGGRSEGSAYFSENSLMYKGNISLENNGGFSSVRSAYQELDLSDYDAVEIRYKNSGQAFSLLLETNREWFRPYFKTQILETSEEWETLLLPLSDFEETRIGEKTGNNLEQSDLSQIIRLGIMVSNKKAGPFEIEIDYIKFI